MQRVIPSARFRKATRPCVSALGALLLLSACGEKEPPPVPEPVPAADEPTAPAEAAPKTAAALARQKGLVLAYSQFDGTKPGPARAELLTPTASGEWKMTPLEDAESNVFHKALAYAPAGAEPTLLTLGGMKAAIKQWRKTPTGMTPTTLWEQAFGGKFDRMRDAELGDLYGTGRLDLAVATHDQGVVAVLKNTGKGFEVVELDKQADTFIHEIELGDLDKDGVLEIYATPSEPNRLDAGEQSGRVVRYVPKKGEGRKVVADLGNRHAKEIYVGDVDGDGRDELYVAVEALTKGDRRNVEIVEPVEIRRYDYDTPADKGVVVARIDDRFCRFLTAGDVDGDGKQELVAAAFRSGVWLLRPGTDPKAEWKIENIDTDSSGFEHAALLTDLDGDRKDELYVAADDQAELRRYVWNDGKPTRSVIRPNPKKMWTWNIMAVPASLLR